MSNKDSPEAAGIPTPPQHSKGATGNEDQAHSPFPIVGIGASAGGFEAFQQLLAHLPQNTGMAFVLMQHLDPHHESRLTELLSRPPRCRCSEAKNGLGVEPNHVYVIPPNSNLAIARGITARDGARRRGAGRICPSIIFSAPWRKTRSRAP